MRYREAAPTHRLLHFVLSFWELCALPGELPPPHEVFPDGCCALVYRRIPGGSGRRRGGRSRLCVAGPTLWPRRVRMFAGDVFWGLRLQPAACRAVTGRAPEELRDRAPEFAAVNRRRAVALRRALDKARNFAAAIAAYERMLAGVAASRERVDEVAAAAARTIMDRGGNLRMGSLIDAAPCGERQLERRFRRAVGLTAKEFARARRIRATAVALVVPRRVGWAQFAGERGYADQAHFAHEIGAATGRTPSQFERAIRSFETGEIAE